MTPELVKQELVIYSDSEYAINSCLNKTRVTANKSMIYSIRSAMNLLETKVTFQWVRGHHNSSNNKVADMLAKASKEYTQEHNNYNGVKKLTRVEFENLQKQLLGQDETVNG
jgi:ribonuclease HI